MNRVFLLAVFVSVCALASASPMPPGIDPDATYSGSYVFERPPGFTAAEWREVLRAMMQQLQAAGAAGDTALSQNEMIVHFHHVPGSTLPDIYNLPNVRVSNLTKDPKEEPPAEEPPPTPAPQPATPASQPWTGNGPLSEDGSRGIPVKNTSGPFYQEEDQPKEASAAPAPKPSTRPNAPVKSGPGNGDLSDEDARLKPVGYTSASSHQGEPVGYTSASTHQGEPVGYTNGPFVKDPPKSKPANDRELTVEDFWAEPTNVWDRNSTAYGDGSRIIYVKLKGKSQPQRMRFDVAKQLGYLPATLAPGDVPTKEP